MNKLFVIGAIALAMTGCATQDDNMDYNTSGPSGSLVRQETAFQTNVCHYDTGLTIYMQGNCPPTVRSNLYTR